MNEQLRPTNKEIAEYILSWMISKEHENYGRRLSETLKLGGNFDSLRKMFAPVLYDSIQDYVDDTKGEKDEI